MAEKEEKSHYPTNGHARSSDTEAAAAAHDASELRRKKRRKCMIFIVIFVVSNIVFNTIFALTLLQARNPRFRIREANVTNQLNVGTPANPMVNAKLNLEFFVKNTNFGRYRYRNTTVVFRYRGTPVGEAYVPNSKVGWRSTKKFNVEVDLNLANGQMDSQLTADLNAGKIPITSHSKLRGTADIMFMMKKRRSADMNCTMEIPVSGTQQIENIACR